MKDLLCPHTVRLLSYQHYAVLARSDAAATIYFIARVCAAFFRVRRLLIPVAAIEAILRETLN